MPVVFSVYYVIISKKESEKRVLMQDHKFILFDLDGTLTDPGLGITNSVLYALRKYHIQVSRRSDLYKFIGPPLHESFENYYGFSKEKAKEAVEYYREYYREKGIFENSLYYGIEDLLKELQSNGKILLLATSKPEIFAKQILSHFNIAEYFSFCAGSNLDGSRTKKDEVIAYALKNSDILNLSDAVMVGDRMHDIIGAKQNHIDSVGVLYGYGSREELEQNGAESIAETVENLKYILQPVEKHSGTISESLE